MAGVRFERVTKTFGKVIATNDVSLTVAEVNKKFFRVWIIPHTYKVTALHERKVGDAVNLEADMLGKYVEKFVAAGKTPV